MRTSRIILPIITLGLGSLTTGHPTEENLLEMMRTVEHIDKRCPYSDMHHQVRAGVHKRLLMDSMNSPIDSTSFPYALCMTVAEGLLK